MVANIAVVVILEGPRRETKKERVVVLFVK